MTGEKTKNSLIYKLMNEIGFERFRIELIENCPCEDVYQLRRREGAFIRLYGTLNKIVEDGCKTNEEYINVKKTTSQNIIKFMMKKERIQKVNLTKNVIKNIKQYYYRSLMIGIQKLVNQIRTG